MSTVFRHHAAQQRSVRVERARAEGTLRLATALAQQRQDSALVEPPIADPACAPNRRARTKLVLAHRAQEDRVYRRQFELAQQAELSVETPPAGPPPLPPLPVERPADPPIDPLVGPAGPSRLPPDPHPLDVPPNSGLRKARR